MNEGIKIVYRFNNNDKIRIFGKIFVNNNKDKCKIIYNDIEYDLKEYLEDIDNNNNFNGIIEF